MDAKRRAKCTRTTSSFRNATFDLATARAHGASEARFAAPFIQAEAASLIGSIQAWGIMDTTVRSPIRSRLRVFCLAIVAIGGVVHLSFLFQVFTIKSAAGLFFPLLVLAPWICLLASVHLAKNRLRAECISLIASAFYLCFGAWAFWDTIHVHPDPQGGLVFLVIPVAASMAALALLLVLLLTKSKSTATQIEP